MYPKFHIPKPCSEDWSKMTPTEKGAFCDKCQIEVRDYTKSSIEVVRIEHLQRTHTCVKIQQHKLDELNFFEWYNHLNSRSRNKYLLILAMLFLSSNHAQAQDFNDSTEIVSIDSVDTPSLLEIAEQEEFYADTIYPEESYLIFEWPISGAFIITDVIVSGGTMPITYGGWGGDWIGNILPINPPIVDEVILTIDEPVDDIDKPIKVESVYKWMEHNEATSEAKTNHQPMPSRYPKEGSPFNVPFIAVYLRKKIYGK